MTSILLPRQKNVFSRDKHVFVATKMILVAAPATDRFGLGFFVMVRLIAHCGVSHSFSAWEIQCRCLHIMDGNP